MEYVNWIVAHAADIWVALASIVTTASVIVKLTPSTKDDAIVARLLQIIALNKK